MIEPDWIALDWGTSCLRAWAMSASGEVLAALSCDQGMAQLKPADFEPVLIKQISSWISAHEPPVVIACGMLGSRQGWLEAPYLRAPCPPLGGLVEAPVTCRRFEHSSARGSAKISRRM